MLTDAGFRTFPVKPNAKSPVMSGWQDTAGKFNGWWKKHPEDNIGVATGKGLLVVDFDVKGGGLESLAFMEDLYGLPQSFRVKTPSGGVHVYLECPKHFGVTISARALADEGFPGVDIRCNGGLVVGPGSEIDGKPYTADFGEWLGLAPAPKWLLDLLRKTHRQKAKPASTREPLVEPDNEIALSQAAEWMIKQAPEVFHGERNKETFKVAARLRDFGVSPATNLDYVLQWNSEKVYPPLDPDEVETTVNSAYQSATGPYGGASPLAEFDIVENAAEIEATESPIKPPPRNKLYGIDFDEAVATALEVLANPLVEDLLDEGALSVMYGDSNGGKTFVLLDIAYHIATGKPWQGRAVSPGLVIYIAAEGGKGIRKRLAALAKHYGGQGVPFVLVPCPVNLLQAKADLPQLITLIRDAEERHGTKAKLVVIDTLSRALAGGDENSSVDMGGFVANVDRLRAEVAAHVSIIHHTGKDQAKGARGWSGLRGAIDTEIEVNKGEIAVTKQRDLEKWSQTMKFVLVKVGVGKDPRGKEVDSCVVRATSGGEFIQIELSGEEQEMLDAFCDCAREQVLARNEPLANWEKEPVTLANWEKGYIEGLKERKGYLIENTRKQVDLRLTDFKAPSMRHLRRLRSSVIQSGHLTEVERNQWVKA